MPKIKILHLEDEPSDALLISHSLKKRKLENECVVADSKEKFIVALDELDPDIILADHSLPSFNSLEALELLEKLGKQIPVILVTATMTDEFAVNIIRKGAKDYVLKDRLERLPSAIENVLKTRRLEVEKEEFLQQLKRNERKFRRLVEHSAGAVAILSSEGAPVYVSPSVENVLGYMEEESLQIIIPEIIHEDHREIFFQNLKECKENPEKPIPVVAVKVRHKNGKWRWLESTITNLLHDPDINGIVLDFRDVTEQKLAERALSESEEKYRAFFENSLDGILLTVPDGRILAANAAACKMFQRTEQEMREVGREGIVDLSDPRVTGAVKEREDNGQVLVDINMVRKDGSVFPASLSSAVFRNGNGEEMTSVIIRDSSEAKRSKDRLEASQKRYRQLFQMSPLPSLIYDLEALKILDVNKAAMNQYGFSHEEFLKLTVLDFIPEEDRYTLKKNIPRMINSEGNVARNQINILKKDGQRIKVEVFGYHLEYKERNSRFIICLDVTEKEANLRKLEEKRTKLLTAQKLAKLGYWSEDLETGNLFWSEEVYNIWERDSASFKPNNKNFRETIHPADRKKFRDQQAKAIKGKEDYDFEHRILLPDGRVKWVHEKGKLVKNREQKLVFEGTVQDITERKKNLEKLMKSEARQRAILQSQTNYLTRMDLEGHYTYCNEKFLTEFGWIFPNEKIVGEYSLSTVKEYDREKSVEVFKKCLDHPNTVQQVELDKLQKDGTVKSTLWDFICLTGAHGEPLEVQGVGIDITERVKAEKALKESNKRYELVSKATSEAIYDWDCSTGKILWSEAYETMFGYETKDLLPDVDDWAEKVHPEDAAVIDDLHLKINGTAEKWASEYRYKKANGDFAYVVERGSIVRDERGNAIRMVGAVQDITKRKKLEELFKKATSLSRIGSFEVDLEKEKIFWSSMTREIHQVSADFVPKLTNLFRFYKEGVSKDKIREAVEQTIKTGTPFDLEVQIITAKGNERWIRVIGEAEFNDGKCIRITGSHQDIDSAKRTELEARSAYEEKEVILESIGDAFFTVNRDFIITYWNSRSAELLQVKREDALGRNLWEIFPDATDTDFYRFYNKALREDINVEFEEYLAQTGNWFGVSVYPSEKGLSVYFRDITERRKAEDKLKELNKNLQTYTEELVTANKGLEQFSYIVSHNLRSPVANIKGLGDLIKEDYPLKVKQRFQEELLANVNRLDAVIKDLNDILQMKVSMSEEKEAVNLGELVEVVKVGIEKVIEKENVQIFTDFTEVPYINSLRIYLNSVFYNLIFNSIKYRKPEVAPVIEITSRRRQGKVVLTFKDNGMGIDLARKRDQVFGLYKRFHHHVEGKGMGLFMVRTQVELMGGKIDIFSEENVGTEFRIEFIEDAFEEEIKTTKTGTLYSS